MPEIVKWQPPRGEAASLTKDLTHMTAIAVDITDQFFAQNPPFRRAFEALSAIAAQYGRARMVAWARAAEDDPTRIVAVMFENTTLALALLRDLDRAHRSGNPKRVAKVRRRFDRVLAAIAAK
jgi:hypothetical protein